MIASELSRTLAALCVVLAAAAAALCSATEEFRVLTSESARRLDILARPRALPSARLADGRELSQAIRSDGRVVLVDFIYTRCESLCTALGSEYQQLQREIQQRGLVDRVQLLSLSFDPAHDDPATLARHQARLRADPAVWQATSIPDPAQLDAVLAAFGIVVLPDGRGDFVHNAAIHVVDARGRLRRVVDPGRWQVALAAALEVE